MHTHNIMILLAHNLISSLSLFSLSQVKDRFCSLLSDSVNQLQKELQDTKKGYDDIDSGVGQNRVGRSLRPIF